MSKNDTAITKKGRGNKNPAALCYPVLSRWGQKWVRAGKRRKCDIDDSDGYSFHPAIPRNNKNPDFVLKIGIFVE